MKIHRSLEPLRVALVAAFVLGLIVAPIAPAQTVPSGDANADGAVNVTDILFLINSLFAGGSIPLGPADANGDGALNVSDVLYLINYLFAGGPPPAASPLSWPGLGRDSRHTGRAPAGAQPLEAIRWQRPVDLDPQHQSGSLVTHYSGPIITEANTVIVIVKTGATDGFRADAVRGSDGVLVWTETLDYSRAPAPNWIPPCGATLTPANQVVFPAAGGTVLRRASGDAASSTMTRFAFYGLSNYEAAPATYAANVKINTPITSDAAGNVYFGFVVISPVPEPLVSGIARVDPSGNGTWTSAATASSDVGMTQVVNNCAPALSPDGNSVYVAVSNSSGAGYLVRLNAATLAPLAAVRLKDLKSGNDASLSQIGTATPAIGPDGDVYYGVFDNPFGSNHARGYMLHFDATLATAKIPGAFGWDNTASIVPSAAVPSYTGSSPYLLFTKYNHYAFNGGGDGRNRIAILDPFEGAVEPVTGLTMMKVVITQLGPTPGPPDINFPDAVEEWCVNTVAIDSITKSAIVNSEDGKVYRWDFTTDTLSQMVTLTGGLFEAYTPTVVGPDGTAYAIQDAVLFAVGTAP